MGVKLLTVTLKGKHVGGVQKQGIEEGLKPRRKK
jgi:hypothetical protein